MARQKRAGGNGAKAAAAKEPKLLVHQPMGYVGCIIFITVLSVFPPLATDMYMPSLPEMRTELATTDAMGTNTIVLFFLLNAIGLLLFGTLSDKYGRKPILLLGLVMFLAASIVCAMATNIWVLLVARAVEGLGGGAIAAVAMALIKDCFPEKRRDRVLVVSQASSALAPIVAPVIGGYIAAIGNWHIVFWVLAAISALCLVATFLFAESNPPELRYKGTLVGNLGRLVVVGKNKGFILLLLSLALLSAPFMCYVTTSSYVYMDMFGLSSTTYGYFFAAAAALMIAAPFIYLVVSRFISTRTMVSIVMGVGIVVGVAMLLLGGISEWAFFFTIIWFLMACSIIRPGTTNALLSQNDGDTGSASSLINFIYTIMSCVGAWVATMPVFPNFVTANACSILIFVVLALVIWVVLLRSPISLRGIKEQGEEHPEE